MMLKKIIQKEGSMEYNLIRAPRPKVISKYELAVSIGNQTVDNNKQQ